MRVLTLNPGSSNLKAALVEDGIAVGWTAWQLTEPRLVLDAVHRWARPDAVAVRFVHGGSQKAPALVTDDLLANLERLVPLAPLHQPASLSVARAVRALLPGVPVVACFDTAFHSGLPAAAAHYPLPRAWTRQGRLRRYGFHGLSCGYVVRRAAVLLGKVATDLQLVCAHVGAGVSVTAVRDGASADTSMGFTPLEGPAMATRSGSIDPGLLLHVMKTAPMGPEEMSEALYQRSGIAGMCGGSGDLGSALVAAAAGDPDAKLAVEVYVHRLRREIGALATNLDRLDALVFTGGVAEYQPEVVAAVTAGLGVLGLRVAPLERTDADRVISAPGSAAPVLIVRTREELELARGAEAILRERVPR
ncbi:acetate/propionate family kinase [Amycolatopsis sp. FDAARGOS 1241]|uniref:acetate/propionate family kinase n=1 Tax=Amycolatopsis sp. FDAARGOS 1241 TaxID=2778070 RepID=UPI0019514379|nr:acetate kinase [Amycolatopsis sp. FDAARGOS 1241]QRP42906.1 acetate kinase [Amycolatopsis sp. FDAARGOS 1241]QRP50357.1 acetate kinase [Amycolatopsis sp. FDAARGOS 1241]